MEFPVPHVHQGPNVEQRRADIRVEVGANEYFVDVTVVNPTANQYLYQSTRQGGSAARLAEEGKMQEYSQYMGADNANHRVIPFGLESSGRLGPRATAFIDTLSDLTGPHQAANSKRARSRRFFMNRMNVILARFNARMMAEYRGDNSRLLEIP